MIAAVNATASRAFGRGQRRPASNRQRLSRAERAGIPDNKNGGGGMTPLVSVIVPIYNLNDYLSRSIESLLAQDYANLELILIDDASTDGSADTVREFAARDARIVPILFPDNRGVSAARNAGLEAATGRYVGFMDGDDWLAPYAMQNFVTALESGPYDLVVTPFYEDRLEFLPAGPKRFVNRELTRGQLVRGMLGTVGQIRGYLWNKFYRRSVIESAHLRFDETVSLMEDELFTAQYIMATSRYYYFGTPAYHHVLRPHSATSAWTVIATVPDQLITLMRIARILRSEAAAGEPEEAVKVDR